MIAWLQTRTAGVYTIGSSPPIVQPSITLPAGVRLVRIHYYPRYRFTIAVNGGTPGVALPPLYHHKFQLNSTQYPNQVVHEFYDVIRPESSALYDSSTPTRVFTQVCYSGFRELGFEKKCSYGGVGTGAITVSGASELDPFAGTGVFSGNYDNVLRVLYET